MPLNLRMIAVVLGLAAGVIAYVVVFFTSLATTIGNLSQGKIVITLIPLAMMIGAGMTLVRAEFGGILMLLAGFLWINQLNLSGLTVMPFVLCVVAGACAIYSYTQATRAT